MKRALDSGIIDAKTVSQWKRCNTTNNLSLKHLLKFYKERPTIPDDVYEELRSICRDMIQGLEIPT